MACSTTLSGILRDCEANAGGIKEILLATRDDVTAVTLDSTGEKVSAITMATSKKFKAFYFKQGQASMTQTPQFNEAGDYAGEEIVVSANFAKMDSTKRLQMNAISVAELYGIVRDANDIYWLVGYDFPLLRNGGESATGANKTDFNHFGWQAHAMDNQLAYEVPASVVNGIR